MTECKHCDGSGVCPDCYGFGYLDEYIYLYCQRCSDTGECLVCDPVCDPCTHGHYFSCRQCCTGEYDPEYLAFRINAAFDDSDIPF